MNNDVVLALVGAWLRGDVCENAKECQRNENRIECDVSTVLGHTAMSDASCQASPACVVSNMTGCWIQT